jgi:thiol-disulfide isomerase/thioredoxin
VPNVPQFVEDHNCIVLRGPRAEASCTSTQGSVHDDIGPDSQRCTSVPATPEVAKEEPYQRSHMTQVILILLGGVALLFIVAQISILLHKRKQLGREVENLKGAVGEAVRTGDRVIAYFYAPSCPVSRTQTPIIDKLAAELQNVFSIDITEEFEAARAIGIHTTPAIVIFEGGEIRDVLEGHTSEQMLREALL